MILCCIDSDHHSRGLKTRKIILKKHKVQLFFIFIFLQKIQESTIEISEKKTRNFTKLNV